jgi:hypothetical protein
MDVWFLILIDNKNISFHFFEYYDIDGFHESYKFDTLDGQGPNFIKLLGA